MQVCLHVCAHTHTDGQMVAYAAKCAMLLYKQNVKICEGNFWSSESLAFNKWCTQTVRHALGSHVTMIDGIGRVRGEGGGWFRPTVRAATTISLKKIPYSSSHVPDGQPTNWKMHKKTHTRFRWGLIAAPRKMLWFCARISILRAKSTL